MGVAQNKVNSIRAGKQLSNQAPEQPYRLESESLSERTDALRMELMELGEKIERINDSIVGPYQKMLKEAEERKQSAEREIAKERGAIASNDRNLLKARSRRKDLQHDLAQASGNMEKAQKRKEEAEEKIKELEVLIERCRGEVTAAEEAYNQSVESDKQLNAEEVEMHKRLKDTQERSRAIEAKANTLRSKIRTLDDQVIHSN